LAVAFAEYRQWPDNLAVQAKCLIYAGYIGHYAQDLCHPLHVTIHFDGWVTSDGTSPRTGIHAKVDGLIQKLNPDVESLVDGQEISPPESLMEAIRNEFQLSHMLVGRAYELERALSSAAGSWDPGPALTAFGGERAWEGVRFTAALYLAAWERSATLAAR